MRIKERSDGGMVNEELKLLPFLFIIPLNFHTHLFNVIWSL